MSICGCEKRRKNEAFKDLEESNAALRTEAGGLQERLLEARRLAC